MVVTEGGEMQHVGVREFRDQATRFLASKSPIAIERHGKLVGFYVPVQTRHETEARQALQQLREAVDQFLTQSGMTEEELAEALDPGRSATL